MQQDNIQILIQELEKERSDLKKLIDEAVKEGEYLIAHFHSEARGKVSRQLQTLKNLADRNHDSKRMIQRMIDHHKACLGMDYPDRFKDHLRQEIAKGEKELAELAHQPKSSAHSTVLTQYLESLISRRIKRVKIVLQKSSNFSLAILRSRSGIKAEIVNIKSLRKTFIMHEENLPHFFALGFVMDASQNKLTLILTSRDKHLLLKELQLIISKIVFEIYYFKEFQGETFIEIRGYSGR